MSTQNTSSIVIPETDMVKLQELLERKSLAAIRRPRSPYWKLQKSYENLFKLARMWFNETSLQENVSEKAFEKRLLYGVKYLIKHGIKSFDEIIERIPRCKYCKSGKFCVVTSKNEISLVDHCGAKKCKDLYTYDKTKESIQEKYGVDNISKLDEIQKKKEETFLKKYGVRHLQQSPEIRKKSKETVKKKYGVDNISKSEKIKEKKKQTFMKHYGIDNIFKDREFIKKTWIEKLGVTNPSLASKETIKKFMYGTYNCKWVEVDGRSFPILSPVEEDVVRYIKQLVDIKAISPEFWYSMLVNDVVLFTDNPSEDVLKKAWIPDIEFFGKYCIEIKSDTPELTEKYVKYLLDTGAKYGKEVLFYMRHNQLMFEVAYIKLSGFPHEIIYSRTRNASCLRKLDKFKNLFNAVAIPVAGRFDKFSVLRVLLRKIWDHSKINVSETPKENASNKNNSESDSLIPDSHELARILGVKA